MHTLSVKLCLLFTSNIDNLKSQDVTLIQHKICKYKNLSTRHNHILAVAWDFQQCGMCNQQSLRSACAYGQSDQSLCWLLEYSTSVKLLTEYHLEFLSLKGGCTGWSESTLVKMPHCWKSHAASHFQFAVDNT